VDLRADNKIRGFQSFVEGAIERRLKNVAKILKDYPHEIKRSDAWELIAKEAKPGDLVIFDPDYIAEKGRKVSRYKVIEEDKSLKIFLKKFDAVVLPKSKSGVRFIITNTWNDDLAKALEERGFMYTKQKEEVQKALKKNSSQQILIEKAKQFIPFMLLQMQDEDLKKLDKDYKKKEEKEKVLLNMLLNPKEKWKELGVPDYLMKYEVVNEE